jgi:predicted ATPase
MEEMPLDNRLLQRVVLRNVLSFGPEGTELGLEKLNVLIGPNGAGKSNLIEAIDLMRKTPSDVRAVLRRSGGAGEWIWKGNNKAPASVQLVLNHPKGNQPLRHSLSFHVDNQGFRLDDEVIENARPYGNLEQPYFYYRFQQGSPVLNTVINEEELADLHVREANSSGYGPDSGFSEARWERHLEREKVNPDLSILAQRRDPEHYPEISYLAAAYDDIRIYRDWAFGRNTIFREPQKADMRNDRLEEDFSNLGLFLNKLRRTPKAKEAILEGLCDLYEGITDFNEKVEGGTVQVFFTEGDFTIPATRLSDGTLRYLCLLAILCDPKPPKLICIEEPELGLHPDILPKLVDLLVDASQRTQIIITTHSDILVDAMTGHPEAVVVCEKHAGCTEMRRLDPDKLSIWLNKYRLGQLWMEGQLGGTRW